MVWALWRMLFLDFPQNFQNNYVKEQSYFHVAGTLEEMHGLIKDLKELRNYISRIIRVWSLFCSIRVYKSQHFLRIRLEN